ncbi:hypothetical protein EON81_03685 [bacterium]|nr:MAG: hypothetical protein EON81_03685 [bacterium]
MRPLLLPVLFLAATAGAQTARYRIYQGEKALGWATVSRTVRKDGGKDVVTTMQIGESRVRTTAHYAEDGSTVTRRVDNLGPADRVLSFSTFRFGPKEIEILNDNLGKRTTSRIPVPEGTADASEGWFYKEKPKPGAKVQSKILNSALKWDDRVTEYIGPREGGHLLRQTIGSKSVEVLVDDEGMPIKIMTSDGVKMLKILTANPQPEAGATGKTPM